MSQERRCTTTSAQESRRLARRIAACLLPGDLLCLLGPLGAGKTTFIQGLAEGLGVTDPVTSPSFTLIHQHRGRVSFFHLDLYRLTPGDLDDIGIDEVLAADAVVAVEWAERLPPAFRDDALEIELDFDPGDDSVRHIALRAHGPRGRRILRAFPGGADARRGH